MSELERTPEAVDSPSFEAFYERARQWQQYLDHNDTGAMELSQAMSQVIHELDQLYPLVDHEVYLSGEGVFPLVGESGEITGDVWGRSEGSPAIHKGFNVLIMRADDKPRLTIMHQALVKQIKKQELATLQTTESVYQYFTLDSVVVPIRDIEAAFYTYDEAAVEMSHRERIDKVVEHSKQLVGLVTSTSFRRLPSRKHQSKLLDEVLIEAEAAASMRDMMVIAEPDFGYVPLQNEEGRYFVPLDLRKVIVSGVCMGLDSLEATRVQSKAIRRDIDMFDKYAGICLVIDPDEDTRAGLGLPDTQVLYVPTANQSFGLQLYTVD